MSALPQPEILLITGPAGVGKSTLCWEISRQLSLRAASHAVIETDELDRIHPKPAPEALARLLPGCKDVSALTLHALWSVYRRLGHHRLIMPGVMMHLGFDKGWIAQAIPGASITVVRLLASEEALRERLSRRESPATLEDQIARTLRQARTMAANPADALTLGTEGQTVEQLALAVLSQTGWAAISTEN